MANKIDYAISFIVSADIFSKYSVNNQKQAGLSRATLEISSEFSSNSPLICLFGLGLDLVLLNRLFFSSSSIGGRLHFKEF